MAVLLSLLRLTVSSKAGEGVVSSEDAGEGVPPSALTGRHCVRFGSQKRAHVDVERGGWRGVSQGQNPTPS